MVIALDVAGLADGVVLYVSAAVAAYGGAVVQKAKDAAVDVSADATVGLGRRMLARLFASNREAQVTDAVRELADDPADEAAQLVLRAQVLKALSSDPQLAAELGEMLRAAGGGDRYQVRISRSSRFQVGSRNMQINVTGQSSE